VIRTTLFSTTLLLSGKKLFIMPRTVLADVLLTDADLIVHNLQSKYTDDNSAVQHAINAGEEAETGN
jgi:hypothetical protein